MIVAKSERGRLIMMSTRESRWGGWPGRAGMPAVLPNARSSGGVPRREASDEMR